MFGVCLTGLKELCWTLGIKWYGTCHQLARTMRCKEKVLAWLLQDHVLPGISLHFRQPAGNFSSPGSEAYGILKRVALEEPRLVGPYVQLCRQRALGESSSHMNLAQMISAPNSKLGGSFLVSCRMSLRFKDMVLPSLFLACCFMFLVCQFQSFEWLLLLGVVVKGCERVELGEKNPRGR